jgi:hypothetical protein
MVVFTIGQAADRDVLVEVACHFRIAAIAMMALDRRQQGSAGRQLTSLNTRGHVDSTFSMVYQHPVTQVVITLVRKSVDRQGNVSLLD